MNDVWIQLVSGERAEHVNSYRNRARRKEESDQHFHEVHNKVY